VETQTTTAPQPKRRGRPKGAKDAAPRKRRPKAVVAEAKVRKVREGDMQAQCMKWLDTIPAPGMPGRVGDYTYAVPNGIWLPGADVQMRIRVIMTMRRQGMKKGVPDVTIALPLHGYHGCIIELKRLRVANSSGPETTCMGEEQIVWLERLKLAGYFVEVAVGVPGFCAAVSRYLAGEAPEPFPWDEVVTGDELYS
jgi:hypothetical protein